MAKKGTQDAAEGGSKKKLIIIVVAVLLVLVGAGVGAYIYLGGEKDMTSSEQQVAQEKQGKVVGPMISIDSFIVNILDDEQSRYLKAAITIEADSDLATQEINERMPQVKDAILLLIGNKTFSELNDLQGKLQLRAELINRINGILVKGKVKRIFFTDFVVQ